MKKLKLYIETSVVGFYHDEEEHNIDKKKATQELFKKIKLGIYEGYMSPFCYDEILNSREPYKSRDMKLCDDNGIELLIVDETKLKNLLNLYRKSSILKPKNHADLIHLAYFILSDADILVSFNCEHINNVHIKRRIKGINLLEGYRSDFEICSPEEVIFDEYERR